MTYQCNKCFKRFDEPDYRILKDDHDFSDELGSHELAKEVCPFCGSGDIGEVA